MASFPQRQAATQATANKFSGKEFAWGKYDCAKMVNYHLSRLGLGFDFSQIEKYSDPISARAAMAGLGFENLAQAMDSKFESIAPARAVLGDIIEFDPDNPLGSLGIALGNNAVFCYVEDHPGGPVGARIIKARKAWRVK